MRRKNVVGPIHCRLFSHLSPAYLLVRYRRLPTTYHPYYIHKKYIPLAGITITRNVTARTSPPSRTILSCPVLSCLVPLPPRLRLSRPLHSPPTSAIIAPPPHPLLSQTPLPISSHHFLFLPCATSTAGFASGID
ncbi:hypothetical protein DM02DRAFT_73667 [Periconia macrospinosa]|uniref:Uncharacterized protein n=1 Tax=Periconia macrospinosa TaxID=97972 RepID=A0A2V1DHM3_9PLEO|nr:hypothetical protein DM02DRAFT_73667 [Periconia macrospinosa]